MARAAIALPRCLGVSTISIGNTAAYAAPSPTSAAAPIHDAGLHQYSALRPTDATMLSRTIRSAGMRSPMAPTTMRPPMNTA